MGDVSDNAYMAEAMGCADYVLCVLSLPRAFDCKQAFAECTIKFLETVTDVIHTAIDCKVKKLLVAGPASDTLSLQLKIGAKPSMPAMLAALMRTVFVVEAHYLRSDSDTTIRYALPTVNSSLLIVSQSIDHSFKKTVNGDIVILNGDRFERIPCKKFGMRW